MIHSITQFLGFISMLELGVGAVVESALYKPLVNRDNYTISCIIKSARKFYSTIAKALLVYVAILLFLYPYLNSYNGDFITSTILIIAISVSSFANYYFGIINVLLLNADQKGYIQYNIQIITLIINSVVSIILITCGASILFVKVFTSLIYLIRPFYLNIYVKTNYNINYKVYFDKDPLPQKWNGVAQHIANLILENTDVILLTIFSTLSSVSIYSIYSLIVTSIERIFSAVTSGLLALWGELWAKKEERLILKQFAYSEWLVHNLVIFLFGCVFVLMLPFVMVYTNGINDANYNQPVFCAILCLAYLVRCLERPYTTMVFASNKFKETQNCYFFTAILNIVISILSVKKIKLVGVAIGTLTALIYQFIWLFIFVYKKVLNLPLLRIFKMLLFDVVSFLCAFVLSNHITLGTLSYLSWFIMAIKVSLIWGGVLLIINFAFYKNNLVGTRNIIRKRL